MIVTMFNVTNPDDKYGWWSTEIKVDSLCDMEKVVGFMSDKLAVFITTVDTDNDELIFKVTKAINSLYPQNLFDIINHLFNIINAYKEVTK